MRVVTTGRGLAATEPHISLTSPSVARYITRDDLCSIKYFKGPHCILQRRGEPIRVITTARGLATTEPPTRVPCQGVAGEHCRQ